MTTVHDFTLQTIDGASKNLGDYAGKVLLLVNVASRCGLTPQYERLETLATAQREQDVEVLGFPCNQFGKQEPGTEEEIKAFCSTTYGVTFPMFAKIDVNGEDQHPLYQWLTAQETTPEGPGDIPWNFAKFVIGKDGHVVARFAPTVEPNAEEVQQAIHEAKQAAV